MDEITAMRIDVFIIFKMAIFTNQEIRKYPKTEFWFLLRLTGRCVNSSCCHATPPAAYILPLPFFSKRTVLSSIWLVCRWQKMKFIYIYIYIYRYIYVRVCVCKELESNVNEKENIFSIELPSKTTQHLQSLLTPGCDCILNLWILQMVKNIHKKKNKLADEAFTVYK